MRWTILAPLILLSTAASAQEDSAPPHCHVPGPFIVFFDAGSKALTSAAKQTLDDVADMNNGRCRWPVAMITGHNDTSERAGISRSRATAVMRYMRRRQWRIKQVSLRAFGSSSLRIETPRGVGERQNRRDEIIHGDAKGRP